MRRVDRSEQPSGTPVESGRRAGGVEVSVVLPCRNNQNTLSKCIGDAQAAFAEAGVNGEVIVADYGSTDSSPAVAKMQCARLVIAKRDGYGAAVRSGAAAARGQWILIAEPNGEFDLREIPRFLMRLRAGNDLVVGCRWLHNHGLLGKGAGLHWAHRLAAPLCDGVARRVFGVEANDTQCSMRAIDRDFFYQLELQSHGVEIDSEMVVKAAIVNGRVGQAPVTLHVADTRRAGWRRPLADAWERLRPFLLMCPQWTLMFPSYLLMMLGVLGIFAACWDSRMLQRALQAPVFGLASIAILVGFQLLQFGLYAKSQACARGILPMEPGVQRDQKSYSLERGIALSLSSMLVGAVFILLGVNRYSPESPSGYMASDVLSLAAPGVVMMSLGWQLLAGELTAGLLGLGSHSRQRDVAQLPDTELTQQTSAQPTFATEFDESPTPQRRRSRSAWQIWNSDRDEYRHQPSGAETAKARGGIGERKNSSR